MKKEGKEYANALAVAIGKQLKERRMERRLSMQNVADACFLTKPMYYHYESGKIPMTISTFILICEYLGLNYILVVEKARDMVDKSIKESL